MTGSDSADDSADNLKLVRYWFVSPLSAKAQLIKHWPSQMTSPQFWLVIFRFSSSVRWQNDMVPSISSWLSTKTQYWNVNWPIAFGKPDSFAECDWSIWNSMLHFWTTNLKFTVLSTRVLCFLVACAAKIGMQNCKRSHDLNPPIEAKMSHDNLYSIGGFKSRDHLQFLHSAIQFGLKQATWRTAYRSCMHSSVINQTSKQAGTWQEWQMQWCFLTHLSSCATE